MPRPSDCIYCALPAGSREHIFPAALGGRRMNRGILCASCNQGFSALDGHLAGQLQVLRGLLGVVPDRKKTPHPAAVPHDGQTLLIDGAGRPSFKDPVTLSDTPLKNGNRSVTTAFANEQQIAAWRAEQMRLGRTVIEVSKRRVGRVMTGQVAIELELGGPETFREAARIALNFLAHRFPDAARDAGLGPRKAYVLGTRTLAKGDPRPVWFLGDELAVPDSLLDCGHQVFLRLDREARSGYAVVRFFDAVELVVDLGTVSPSETVVALFDIDPFAEHEPHDLFERVVVPESFPPSVALLKVGDEASARTGDAERLMRLFDRISERQSRARARALSEALERVRLSGTGDVPEAVAEVLRGHEGTIYRLIERIAADFSHRFAAQPAMQAHAACLKALAAPDPAHETGLSREAREAVEFARLELADEIAVELASGPVPFDRLAALLEGGEGAAIVARFLLAQINDVIDRVAAASAHANANP